MEPLPLSLHRQRLKVEYDDEKVVAPEIKTEPWEPPNWEKQLGFIREMRSRRDAPVDYMGAGKCFDTEAPAHVGTVWLGFLSVYISLYTIVFVYYFFFYCRYKDSKCCYLLCCPVRPEIKWQRQLCTSCEYMDVLWKIYWAQMMKPWGNSSVLLVSGR